MTPELKTETKITLLSTAWPGRTLALLGGDAIRTGDKMVLRRYKDIVAMQTASGEVLGFHTRNLEVAQLAPEVWSALHDPQKSSDVIDELNLWNDMENPEVKDSHLKPAVRSLTINVSQICNLRCTYCGAGDGSYGSNKAYIEVEKTLPQIRHFMEKTPRGETFRITFLGGEPLLYPEAIRTIADYTQQLARESGLESEFIIVTNGTLVTDTVAEMLALIHCHVRVSLDGPAHKNDEQRPSKGGKGTTEKTIQGLHRLEKVRDRLGSLSVNSVFGKHNTQVKETYEFLRQFQFDDMNFNFAASPDDGQASQEFIEQMCLIADEAFARGGEAELRKITEFERLFSRLDCQIRTYNYCGAGKNLLQIDTQNKFYACNWFMSNADDQLGSGTNLDPEKMAEYRDPLLERHQCGTCWARFMCGGGCMFANAVKTGNKHLKDNQFCQRTRSLVAKGVELYGKARKQEGEKCEIH